MKLFLLFFFGLFISLPVQANTAFWEDPETHIRITYPFEWRIQNNGPSAEILHIRAPYNEDLAQCRLEAIEDRRFVIYPREILNEVNNRELADEYWETFVARFTNPNIKDLILDQGLAQGNATYALVDFTNSQAQPGVRMRGIYFASLYGDLNVNMGCAVEANKFDKWAPVFFSIVDTLEFPEKYNILRNGHYRNFFRDGVLYFKDGSTQGSISRF